MTPERDIRNPMAYARKEGREEGASAKAIQIAAAMKAAGEPMDKITLFTGLSADEIARLD